jgi:D-beta-D-heptose 7-phosphate kinase/D-beta-D-heptose 1-phosphate adenosyltransferase
MRITVIGDLILDHYLHCTRRRNLENGGWIYMVESEEYSLGGAAAVARLAKAMGAEVTLYSPLDCMAEGWEQRKAWDLASQLGIKFGSLNCDGPVSVKQRIVCDGLIAGDRVDRDHTAELRESLPEEAIRCDRVLIADYGKGACTSEVLKAALRHPGCIVDPARGRNWAAYRGASLIKPNLTEARFLTPSTLGKDVARHLSETFAVDTVVTLGASGMFYASPEVEWIPAEPALCVDPTGAGDTVLAALGVSWGVMDPIEACRYAAKMAALQVEKLGVCSDSTFSPPLVESRTL